MAEHTLPADLTDPITARPAPADADLRDRIAAALRPAVFPEKHSDSVARWLAENVMTVLAPVLAARDARTRELEETVRAARAAVDSAGNALAFSSRDWGVDHRDAWLYAILLGWACEDDHEHDDVCEGSAALTEIADRHRWDADTVARVTRHRGAITQLDQISARDTTEEADRG